MMIKSEGRGRDLAKVYVVAPGTLFHQIRANPRTKLFERRRRACFTTTGPERFFTKLEQTHARNFLKDAVGHVLLANPKPCVKRLLNTCLVKNL
jgi:hypothetical protein